jgi:glycine hydroxymethyltransferase
MVDMAHIAGLVAAGVHPSPFGYADVVTTTTHKTLRGPRGGLIFCKPELEKKINSGVFPGTQGGPLEHVILAKAICAEEALRPSFKEYIEQVVSNAKEMADTFVELGYDVVTGGTDIHLFLIDFSKTHPELTGRAV